MTYALLYANTGEPVLAGLETRECAETLRPLFKYPKPEFLFIVEEMPADPIISVDLKRSEWERINADLKGTDASADYTAEAAYSRLRNAIEIAVLAS